MVTITVQDSNRVTVCRLQLPLTCTVQQLMAQVAAVRPELREATHIRNERRAVDCSIAQDTNPTLLSAGLADSTSTEEELVVSCHSPAAPSASRALDEVVPEILRLFQTGMAGTSRNSTEPPRPANTAPQSTSHHDPLTEMVFDEQDVEMQRRLYEALQQRQIDENFANALEYTPEAFADVIMLYVPCSIHQIPLKAFVDSGAQKSIMNVRTAERCGLMRLLDQRMQGVAKGVGEQRILGRIHMAMVELNSIHIPFSFCVLENQEMDLIIGLDQLKRHQMSIDLKSNCLRIASTEVPFLSEAELPDYARIKIHEVAEEEEARAGPTATTTATKVEQAPPATPVVEEEDKGDEEANKKREAVGHLMAFTGIADPKEAEALLVMSNWDADVAATLFFDA